MWNKKKKVKILLWRFKSIRIKMGLRASKKTKKQTWSASYSKTVFGIECSGVTWGHNVVGGLFTQTEWDRPMLEDETGFWRVIGVAGTDFIRTFGDKSQRSQLISKRDDAEQLTVRRARYQRGHNWSGIKLSCWTSLHFFFPDLLFTPIF